MLIIVSALSVARLTQLSRESSDLSGVHMERNRLAQEWRSNTYLNAAEGAGKAEAPKLAARKKPAALPAAADWEEF